MIEHAARNWAMTWLVNALWIVPLVAATAGLCSRFGGLGPRGRHAAWMGALILAAGLPAAPAALVPFHLAAPVARTDLARLPSVSPGAMAAGPAPAADPPPMLAFDRAWTRSILLIVGAVMVITLCRLLVALVAGGRLVRAARACDLDPDVRTVLARGARSAAPILESEAISSPVVVGALRPAILVPAGFNSLPWDEQRAALLHEMAHVTRHDYAWNLVCEAVSLPLAWHPAILPIKAGVRRSREAACDALAAEAMASTVTYARCLVSLATRLSAPRPVPALAVGLIGKSDLEERLMDLLKPKPDRASGALRMAGAVALAAAVLTPAVFLRVTPAFADEPVIARRLLAPASQPPMQAASSVAPATPIAPVSPPARKAAPRRVASVQQVIEDAVPPAPPAPPAPASPPPPPPAEPMDDADMHEHMSHHRYEMIVHHALEQALGAEKVMESNAMRHAMAELRANQEQMTRAEQAKLHAEFASAMAEFNHARVEETLAKVRSQLKSSDFRDAIVEAAHKAAAEVRAEARAEVRADDKD